MGGRARAKRHPYPSASEPPDNRRPTSTSTSASATLLIVGAQSDEPLGLMFGKAFGGVSFVSDPTAVNADADISIRSAALALGIFESAGDQRLRMFAFSRWAYSTGIPSLCVEHRPVEAQIGPLALPNRAGCAECARQRLIAAQGHGENPGAQPTAPSSRSVARAKVALAIGRVLVREVRAILRRGPERSQLLNHVLFLDTETLDASLHRVIPLSRCPICGGASAFPSLEPQTPTRVTKRLSPENAPEDVLAALAGWVDTRTGIISGVYLEPPSNPVENLPIIATTAPPHVVDENRSGSLRRLPLGWGKGLTISSAVLSAVGEALERYAASLPDPDRIVWARPGDLEGERLDPRAFTPYADAQYARSDFPFARFDPDVPHPWVLGKWLRTGAPVWIPAVLAFLSLPELSLRPEHVIFQGSSSGLAAATDPEEAALRATLELVERDAFLTAWLTACPGQRIELDDTLDPLLRRVLVGIEALGATVEVYTLPTSACGTTVLCLGLGNGDTYPGATIGLGSDLDPCLALRQAVLELGQTGPYLRRMMRSHQLAVPDEPAAVQDMLQHAAYYFPRQRAQAFDRLRHGNGDVDGGHRGHRGQPCLLRDLAECGQKRTLINCAAALDAADIRVALVDVTSADVATGPFRVMRAVSPDLQPLSYGYGMDSQPVARIRNLGLASDAPAIHPIM